MKTVQICPLSDCRWINPIVEDDEPTVFAASMATFEHLLAEHQTAAPSFWREVILRRVRLEDVMTHVESR